MIRLLLADDHQVLRRGMARLLEDEPDIEVIGEASNGAECLELEARLRPDLILLDLNMPGGAHGLEVARTLRQRRPECALVVLSSECRPDQVRELIALGVKGYVSKASDPGDVVRAVHLAHAGRTFLAPEAAEALATSVQRPGQLNERCRTVLELSARGLTVREIAEQLSLSPKTIEKLRGQILQQMNVRNILEAAQEARQLGWL